MPPISGALLNSGSCRRCHKDGGLKTVDILAYMSDKVSQSLGPRGMDKMVLQNSASLIVLPDFEIRFRLEKAKQSLYVNRDSAETNEK